jgi:hypothetical protein
MICIDEDLVSAEFAAIIAGSWDGPWPVPRARVLTAADRC